MLPPMGQPAVLAPDEFKSSAPSTVVTFANQNVSPPSSLYIQRDDKLVIGGMTQAGVPEVLTVTARLLLPNAPPVGQPSTPPGSAPLVAQLAGNNILTIQATLNMPVALTSYALPINLAEGYLLSLTVTCAQASFRGQTFAKVMIARSVVNTQPQSLSAFLLADYVANNFPIGWPNGRCISSIETPGYIPLLTAGNPGVGSDFVYTSPANTRSRLKSFSAKLTTSATAGTRGVAIGAKDVSGNILFLSPAQSTQAASLALTYSGIQGSPAGVANATAVTITIPQDFIIEAQSVLFSSTAGLLAGDQWSAIVLCLETWLESV